MTDTNKNPDLVLMIVQISSHGHSYSAHLVHAVHPREVAAFYMEGMLPDDLVDKLKIKWSHRYAKATAGSYRVEVKIVREPVLLIDDDFLDSRDMLERFGEAIPPQYLGEEA